MRRRLLLFVFSCLVVLVPSKQAIAVNCTDSDLVAIVFGNDDINWTPGLYVPYEMNVVLLNPSLAGLDAVEFRLMLPSSNSSLFFLSETLAPGAINFGAHGADYREYIVGFPTPQPTVGGRVQLISFSMMNVASLSNLDFYLSPVSTPSIPGRIAYNVTTFGTSHLLPMIPISKSFTSPIARLFPQTPLSYCESIVPNLSMTISGEGETIIAGTAAGTTDGYDASGDLPDSTPLLTFPHPEWTGSPSTNYQQDLRAPYDPTAATKTWTFTAAAASAGSPDYQVGLSFAPSFLANSGIAVQLHDRVTGNTVDLLNAGMQYSFTSTTARTFDLTIGTDAPLLPELVIDIATTAGQFSDPLTRAATDAQATDGFDGTLDQPEPSPAPGNYLAASFEHADWPLGPRFGSDVRAPFDPTTEIRTWPLMVETDQSGPVVLTFSPSFTAAANIGLQLRDLGTGQIYNLFPQLSYVYQGSGVATVRRFELIVGAAVPPELSPVSRALSAGWSMVGLPLAPAPGQNTMSSVLLSHSPGYAYGFTFERLTGYHIVPGTAVVAPGTGYWLGTSAPFNWTMSGTRSLDGVTVPLTSGWNLVGNANWFPGPFEGLRVVHNGTTYDWLTAAGMGLVSTDVQSYNNATGTYFDAVDLQPWQGYWINALTSNISLVFHWPNFQDIPARLAAPSGPAKAASASWRTDLVLTDAQENVRMITFGVEAEATSGFDAVYDRPQPPAAPVAGPALSFQHPEWNLAAGSGFTRDLVGPGEDPVSWPVALTAPTAGKATLSWDPANWPEGVDYQLYFPSENRVVVMSMRRQTSLAVNVGPQPFTVIVRTPDMTSGVGDLPADANFGLNVRPNPFNPRTAIDFALPRPGNVEIRIYSVRGELVTTLGGHVYAAGRHQETWNGTDRQGRDVPSGSYFGRLHVDGMAQGKVIRMSLVR